MGYERNVKLFRSGDSQAVHIPREFELPGTDAVMRKEGGRIVIEAVSSTTTALVAWLKTQEPIEDDFGEIEDLPPEDVDF